MASIKKNYLYNVLLELSNIAIPIITVPYISRILGPEGVGIVAFRQSIVQYFVLLGSLGLSLYGNRAIATVRDDIAGRNRLFCELVCFKVLTCLIALCVFLAFLLIFRPAHLVIYVILALNLLSTAIDITWFFMGLEDFKKTVSRSLFVKFLGVLMIFGLVKSPSDVHIYAFIGVSTGLLGQGLLWKYLPDTFSWDMPRLSLVSRHFLPVLQLFLPMVAIQVYVVMDTTMVGFIAGEGQVGIYTMSQRLVKMLLSIVTAMGVVMIPRMSYYFAKEDNEAALKGGLRSYRFASYSACLFMTPLLSVIRDFAPWFFGQAFKNATPVITLCSGVIFFIALNNVLGLQILIPQRKERLFSIAVITGAFLNFCLNIMLIPKYSASGAAFASSLAECAVWLVELYFLRSFFNLTSLFASNVKDVLAMVVSVTVVHFVPKPECSIVFRMIFQSAGSVFLFLAIQFFNRSGIQSFLIESLFSWRSKNA